MPKHQPMHHNSNRAKKVAAKKQRLEQFITNDPENRPSRGVAISYGVRLGLRSDEVASVTSKHYALADK
jgi:hypothetical protein